MTDVTIIVATHDRPAMLTVELHSILASIAMAPERSVRVLVVDDCSRTLAAKAIAKRLGVDYLRLPENVGIARTLVAGFEQTDSEYTSFWGDDDYMLPRWLPLHLAKIEEGFDVVSGSYWQTDANLRYTHQRLLPVPTMRDLLAGKVTANDGSLIRRSALEGIPWRPERERAMMMTMWLALVAAKRRFAVVNECTWLYRRHAGNMSARSRQTEHDMDLRRQAIAEYA